MGSFEKKVKPTVPSMIAACPCISCTYREADELMSAVSQRYASALECRSVSTEGGAARRVRC